ncbi:phosphatidate cytidylyltransferase [Marinobacter zhanjiangensis]|uniref:Phosphatidate cytidylyltransferase n=1 Tax=Marinobacter zhanjiangensis TaxID=578215 RepID=A0ABQ3B2T6_9GAMM|nr:phosphatidate cytidylyltransferase [Marinobacter zhanjiangensis]GGY76706.1 phosphatidate cytidylyltransferase [Marinobacter zhanjiangensis]
MLKTRILTALILAPIAIIGIFFLPPLGFAIFTGVAISLGAWEWANMAGYTSDPARAGYAALMAVILVAVYQLPTLGLLWLGVLWWVLALLMVRAYPAGSPVWGRSPVRAVMGLLVLVPAWVGLNHLRNGTLLFGDVDNSLVAILYVFLVVWVADIGAYFAGRAFGRAKLAPRVSPGKSWAGVWGGLAAVALLSVAAGVLAAAALADTVLLLLASMVVAGISVVGDLVESMLKRFRGIKDSSQLLPGHGGIMDRIDSLTAAIPVFALAITLLGWLSVGAVS